MKSIEVHSAGMRIRYGMDSDRALIEMASPIHVAPEVLREAAMALLMAAWDLEQRQLGGLDELMLLIGGMKQ